MLPFMYLDIRIFELVSHFIIKSECNIYDLFFTDDGR